MQAGFPTYDERKFDLAVRKPEPPTATHLFPLGYVGGRRGEFDRVRRSKLTFSRNAPGFRVGHTGLERDDPDHVEHDGKNGIHDQSPHSDHRCDHSNRPPQAGRKQAVRVNCRGRE
jgi:hypothetical protein